jgi:MATE family multidrug resistance protein
MKQINWPEIKLLLWLALPLIAGQLAQTGMGVVDTMMAGGVSKLDLAGVALGTAVWLPTFLFTSGILLALTPSIAQAVGREDYIVVKQQLMQGVWLALALAIFVVVVLISAKWWILWFSLEAAVREIALGYLMALAWGALPALLFQTIRNFHESHGLTKVTMYLSFLGFLLNIPLNFLFVYGYGPIPALGGVGCGVATSLVYVVMAGGGWLIYFLYKRYQRYHDQPLFAVPNGKQIKSLLIVGVPIGWAILFEVGLFTFIAFLVTPLGTDALAAHQVAISYTALIFMLPLSLAMALTVRVGQLHGANNKAQLTISIRSALYIAISLGMAIALGTWLFSHNIIALYTKDSDVALVTASLLLMAALYQVSDAIQVTCAGALRGIGDTTAVMWVTLISYWGIGLPAGFYLCYGAWDMHHGVFLGITGFWLSFVIGLSAAAVGLGWRVYRKFYCIHDATASSL